MIFRKAIAIGGLFALGLTGCGGSSAGPPSQTRVNPLSSVLQFSVGTANIFGDTAGSSSPANATGLNVVVTLRQPRGAQTPGDTGALVDTPQISGPMTLPAGSTAVDPFGATVQTGPCVSNPSGFTCVANDAGGSTIHSTPQQNPGANIPPSTFGVSGNASGLGIEPFNYSAGPSQGFGVPDSFVPWNVPLFDPIAGDPNSFTPWGGPPAFDPNHDGKGTRDNSGFPAGVLGVSEGLDVFEGIVFRTGAYTLSVSIPTGTSTSGTLSQQAILGSSALLPAILPPTVTLDGKGGGSFKLALPPGATEGYVQIVDTGPTQPSSGALISCNGSDAAPVYYTIPYHSSGAGILPATDGPGNPGTTSPSICTPSQNAAANGATSGVPGDNFIVQSIGFDYPAYESSYPNSSGNPAPNIKGLAGQSDVTISSAPVMTATVGAVPRRLSVSEARAAAARLHRLLLRRR